MVVNPPILLPNTRFSILLRFWNIRVLCIKVLWSRRLPTAISPYADIVLTVDDTPDVAIALALRATIVRMRSWR